MYWNEISYSQQMSKLTHLYNTDKITQWWKRIRNGGDNVLKVCPSIQWAVFAVFQNLQEVTPTTTNHTKSSSSKSGNKMRDHFLVQFGPILQAQESGETKITFDWNCFPFLPASTAKKYSFFIKLNSHPSAFYLGSPMVSLQQACLQQCHNRNRK